MLRVSRIYYQRNLTWRWDYSVESEREVNLSVVHWELESESEREPGTRRTWPEFPSKEKESLSVLVHSEKGESRRRNYFRFSYRFKGLIFIFFGNLFSFFKLRLFLNFIIAQKKIWRENFAQKKIWQKIFSMWIENRNFLGVRKNLFN